MLMLSMLSLSAPQAGLPDYSFEKFAVDFNKQYATVEERAHRASIFGANLQYIIEQNRAYEQGTSSFYAAVNEYADLTNAEFRAKRTGLKGKPNTLPTYSAVAHKLIKDLPDSVDWRTHAGVVTPVKNQEACGSCWAFSATETLESAFAIATSQDAPVLSPQQIVSCAPNPDQCGGTGGCQGSTQPLAFNYTKGAGISLDSAYPYTSGGGETGKCDTSKIAPVVKNDGYVQLPANKCVSRVPKAHSQAPTR
jgi:cathepsin L